MRVIAGLLLIFSTVACQQATAPSDLTPVRDVSGENRVLSTDRDSYLAGAVAVIRLSNPYEHALGYNLCHAVLERQTGAAWQRAGGSDRVCTMELRRLASGQTVTYSRPLESSLAAGEYRFRTTLENMSTGVREPVVSNTFRVTR